MSVITFVTGNKNKLRETRSILDAALKTDSDAAPFTLVAEKFDLPEMQGTPEEIAVSKCRVAAERVKGPVVRSASFLTFPSTRHQLTICVTDCRGHLSVL